MSPRPILRPLGRALGHHRQLRAGIVQLVYVLLAFGIGLAVPQIAVWFTLPSNRVIESLFAVGVAIVTFIGLVYSLLFLVVQFGSTAFTPRLNLFRDAPIVWHAFGFYTGIIVFSFTAAFSIGKDEQASGLVPIVLMLALLVALVLFRALQTAAFHSVQLASTLAQVGKRGREVIRGVYPTEIGALSVESGTRESSEVIVHEAVPDGQHVRWRNDAAVLQVVDIPHLVRIAQRAGVVIDVLMAPGDTVPEGGRLAVIRGGTDSSFDDEVLKALRLGPERTFEQDPRFALRVLADIALRALSPAVNDPTTAVQALDSIDSLLRLLAARDLDVGRATDSEGVTRVLFVLPTWEEYVGLSIDEVISMGSASIQVRTRLERLLEELVELTPSKNRLPVQRRLQQLRG